MIASLIKLNKNFGSQINYDYPIDCNTQSIVVLTSSSSIGSSASTLTGAAIASTRGFFACWGVSKY